MEIINFACRLFIVISCYSSLASMCMLHGSTKLGDIVFSLGKGNVIDEIKCKNLKDLTSLNSNLRKKVIMVIWKDV